jgi:protein phosphatase
MNFDIEAYCDQGGLRQANEDMVTIDGVIVDSSPDRAPACEGATDHLLLVADGMGGHPGGLAASALAAKYLGDLWMAEREALDIVSALRATNRAIYEAMAKSSEIRGMGTTIAGVHLLGTRLRWFNVGDSRVYVYRGGALIQLSVDHAIGEGDIYPAGTLTQCLGGSATFIEIEPSMGDAEILANDKVIIRATLSR